MSLEFKIPTIYPTTITVIIDSYDKYCQKLYRRHKLPIPDDDRADVKAYTQVVNSSYIYLWFPVFKNTTEYHGYLVHELVHVIDAVFDDIGLESTKATSEARAYLTGYIYEKFVNKVCNVRKR